MGGEKEGERILAQMNALYLYSDVHWQERDTRSLSSQNHESDMRQSKNGQGLEGLHLIEEMPIAAYEMLYSIMHCSIASVISSPGCAHVTSTLASVLDMYLTVT